MHPEPENFEPLRRLLAWKRHEQPPPGFFDDFSRRVIVRIKTGDLGDEAVGVGQLFWEAPWFQRFWTALERKPALAGAFGLSVCGLLLAGIICSVAPKEPGSQDVLHGTQSLQAIAALRVADQAPVFVSSTNGVMPEPLQNSLFEQFRNSQVQPRLVRVSEPTVGP
ncbi:MAG: hypothetical protein ABSF95_04145 [Verrucomicrobiota bacterium]|jgi:hypothetical protein